MKPIIESDGYKKDVDYVDFGDVSRKRLGQQCQYGSRYINGLTEGNGIVVNPCLGYDLRFIGNDQNYHSWQIHKDDIEEFVRRVEEYKESRYA